MIDILRPGDIILFHRKGFNLISLGIRFLTRSYWNHVGMYVIDWDEKGYVIEALGQGVVRTPIQTYEDNKNFDFRVLQIERTAFKDDVEYSAGLGLAQRRMKQMIGTEYDWWAIVYLGIKYIARGIWNKGAKHLPQKYNPFQSRYRFFCSELICQACFNISSQHPLLFMGETQQDCGTTTPKDIAKSKNVKHLWGKNVI